MSQLTWADVTAGIQKCKERLAYLAATNDKPQFWNRCYPIDIPLPLYSGTAAFGSFTIDQGTTFYAKSVEAFYTVTGTLIGTSGASPATVTIPESIRPQVLEYTWMIHDSGSDRDWSNLPVPSEVVRSGNVNGMTFGRGQARMRGGSRATVTINPTYFSPSFLPGVENISSHAIQFIVSGISLREVRS